MRGKPEKAAPNAAVPMGHGGRSILCHGIQDDLKGFPEGRLDGQLLTRGKQKGNVLGVQHQAAEFALDGPVAVETIPQDGVTDAMEPHGQSPWSSA